MVSLDEEKKGIDRITIDLTFPGEDIQLIHIENALQWLRTQIMKSNQPWREQGGIDAFNVLNSIHTRVLKAIGHPEWIYPSLEIERPVPPPDITFRIIPRHLITPYFSHEYMDVNRFKNNVLDVIRNDGATINGTVVPPEIKVRLPEEDEE